MLFCWWVCHDEMFRWGERTSLKKRDVFSHAVAEGSKLEEK